MRIVADDQIFAGSAHSHPELHDLLLACRDGRHQLEVLPPAAPCLARWLTDHAGSIRDHYQEILDTSQRELAISARRVTVSIPKVPLRTALTLVKTPLYVLVENERNDGAFLRAVLRGPRKQEWQAALSNRYLAFYNGGGMQEIEKRIQSNGAEAVEPLRTFVLFDSDARQPGEPSSAARQLMVLCRSKGVQHHMLRRRERENYLPVESLAGWLEVKPRSAKQRLRPVLGQYRRLTEQQRHHFNMRYGLKKDTEQPELFATLDVIQQKVLQIGFGEDVGQIFNQPEQIADEWLIDDGQRDEMESLLDDILALL